MKILAVSDEESPALWDYYVPGRLAEYDLILGCGDLKAAYLTFLTTMSRARVLYVHGNHDGSYLSHPPEGCECIDDQLVVYNGVRILGLGGCLMYHPGPFQYTERQMRRRIRRLRFALWRSGGVDIVVTHAPPRGLGDLEDPAHRGFQALVELLENLGFRAEGDYRNEKIGYKIREAQMQKVPYMLVIGDKEAESGDLSVRTRSGEQFNMTVDEFIARLRKEVDEKTV